MERKRRRGARPEPLKPVSPPGWRSLSEFRANRSGAVGVDEMDRLYDEQICRKSSDEDFSFGVAFHGAGVVSVDRDGVSCVRRDAGGNHCKSVGAFAFS